MGHFPAGGGSGGGSVDEITSDDDTVTITDPTGPTVDLSVEGGGGGWPSADGTGPGNLTAETPTDDTVGYNFTDQGSGGFAVDTAGTAGIDIKNSAAGQQLTIENDASVVTAGLQLTVGNAGDPVGIIATDSGSGGITLNEQGTGGIDIETTGGNATTGITLTTQATDTGGITLVETGAGGIFLNSTGTGAVNATSFGGITIEQDGAGDVLRLQAGNGGEATGGILIHAQTLDVSGITLNDESTGGGLNINSDNFISLDTAAGAGSPPAGIELTTDPTDTGGIEITDQGSGGITLTNAGSGNIILTGIPTTDPGVAGALYTTAGALFVSTG